MLLLWDWYDFIILNLGWDYGVRKGVRGWGCSMLHFYYAKNAGEGYFPAMEILHKGKQNNFLLTISQFL